MAVMIRERWLNWFGHVARMKKSRFPNRTMNVYHQEEERGKYQRSRGKKQSAESSETRFAVEGSRRDGARQEAVEVSIGPIGPKTREGRSTFC